MRLDVLLSQLLEQGFRDLAVCTVGTVVSYADGRARVQPGVQRRVLPTAADGEDTFRTRAEVPSAPVVWLGGGDWGVHAPLQPGDKVLLVVCDEDPAAFLRSGSVSRPEDAGSHSAAYSIAIPLVGPPAHAETGPAAVMTAGHASAPVRFTSSGIEVDGATDAAALASKLDDFGQALATLTNPVSAADALTVTQAVVTAAKAVWGPAGLLSVASTKIKAGG